MAQPIYYRLRIRDVGNTTDALVITSVRAGTLPWLESAPTGDGQEFDPLTGSYRAGAFTGTLVDGITSGSSRVMTSQLEDANFRQQLIDRRSFLDWSYDGATWTGGTSGGVLVAGYLTALRLLDGIRYQYTVSDALRALQDHQAFAPQIVIDSTSHLPRLETIPEFLARWPLRGCIFGGPIRGGFTNPVQKDLGGWEMSIDGRSANQALLTFKAGYTAPTFDRSTRAEDCMSAANAKTDALFQFSYGQSTDQAVQFNDVAASSFRGIVIEVINPSTRATYGFYQAMSGVGYFPFGEFTDNGKLTASNATLQKHLLKDIRHRGVYIGCATSLAASNLPAAGSGVLVRGFTAEASELSPIYWTGHPVDLIAALLAEAVVDYDSSSATTAKNGIGTDLAISVRVKAPQALGSLVTALCGAFGIGLRINDSGQVQFFAAREFTSTPTVTITGLDVQLAQGGAPQAFYIDRATAVRKVTFAHTRFVTAQNAGDGDAVDGFVEQPESWEIPNPDTNAVGNATQDYTIEGMVTRNAGSGDGTALDKWVRALAAKIFDRYGRSLVEGELAGLRGGSTDGLLLGQEVFNQLPQLPNHNYRLGDNGAISARRMQVVRITPTPSGPMIKLADSGPNTNPYATQPTVTLAASSNAPQNQALATVTNASTLNAVPAGVRLQMAVSPTAPVATAYSDVDAYPAGQIPTTAFPLPSVASGSVVWIRARTELPGSQPSTWSTPVSLTLAGLPAVTSLAAAAQTDGSTELLTWTPGDTMSNLDIYLRASGASAVAAVRQRVLPPGSTRFLLEGLTPGTAYTASVQARNAGSGDVSTLVDVTFTAGASGATLPPPILPNGFSGSLDPFTGVAVRDGTFGIAVVALDYPGSVEVAVATETAVGSGTYGSFATSGTVMPSVQGAWAKWQDYAPNDGLRRQLKARHVRDGCSPSSYTSIVTVLPWTVQLLPAYVSNNVSDVVNATAANNGTTANVPVQFDNQTAIGAGCARYSLNGGSSWTTGTVASDYSALFTGIARTSSVQTMIIQGLNAIDGQWGNQTSIQIDPYTADVPSLAVRYEPLTSTTGQIVWSCPLGVLTYWKDGVSLGTPPASPIAITLDGSTHNYAFVAALGSVTDGKSVTVPAVPPAALPIVYLWNSAQSTTADTITMQWTVTNAPASPSYDLLWSNDRGATITTIAGVSTPYVHNKTGTGGHGYDIVAGGTITTLQYAIVVKDSGVTVAQSAWRDVDVDHV
jgi:hypothetical protein